METKPNIDLKPEAVEDEYNLDEDNAVLVLYFAGLIEELLDGAVEIVERKLEAKEIEGENDQHQNQIMKEEENVIEESKGIDEPEEEPNAKVEEKQEEEAIEDKDEADEESNEIEPENKSKGKKWKTFKKQMKKLFCCCMC